MHAAVQGYAEKGGKNKRAIFFRRKSGDFTAADLASIKDFAGKQNKRDAKYLQALSMHDTGDGQTGMIVGNGNSLTEKGAAKVDKLLTDWSISANVGLEIDNVATTTTFTGNDWKADPHGRSYLSDIKRLGGDSQVRKFTAYRGQYIRTVDAEIRREQLREQIGDRADGLPIQGRGAKGLDANRKSRRRSRRSGKFSLRGDGVAGRSESGSDPQAATPLAGAPKRTGATGPILELVSIAHRYAADNGIDLQRQPEYVRVDVERATRTANAYEEMLDAPSDPAVQAAYIANLSQFSPK